MESIKDGFFALDEDFRFYYLNGEAENILDQKPEELLGKTIWETYPGTIGTTFEEVYRRVMTGGKAETFTAYFPDHDRWYEVRTYPSAKGISVYFDDATQRKRAEMNTAFIAEISLDLTRLTGVDEIMQATSSKIGSYFGVDSCAFAAVDTAANTSTIKTVWLKDETAVDFSGTYNLSEFVSNDFRSTLQSGKSVVVNDVAADERTKDNAAKFEPLKIASFINTPYLSEDDLKFVLGVWRQKPYEWRTDEIELLEELIARVWARIERARAEEDLRQSEEIFRVASDAAAALVYDVDLTGNRKTVAHGMERVTGYTYEEAELSAEWFHALIHPEDLSAHLENLERQMKSGGTYRAAHRLRRKDGAWIYVEDTGQLIRDENGTAIQLVGAIVDVTIRKQSEEALRESEERFRSLFDSIDEGFCIIEMIFDENNKPVDYRFVQANPAMETLTGLTDAIGRTIREMVPDLEEFWFETYGKVALTGEPARFENEAVPLNRWFEVYASRVGDSTSRVAIVFNNITERKLVERERERLLEREKDLRREAEDANRAKEEFLAILSHELRTPLNSIFGWTQILEASDFDREKTKLGIETIGRNVRLQNALIEDLLDVSRIISGKMQLENEPLSLFAVVQGAVDAIRPTAEQKSIKIEDRLDAQIGETNGDKFRLQQIFNNLLTNAVKFTPAGGTISVTLERSGETAVFSVKDSGIGISPELLPYIFDRFRQADASSKRQFGGLGLGLTIVKNLVELHGGTVSASSDGENSGATFIVELPLSAQTESPSPLPSSSTAEPKTLFGKRILVVDDEQDALELMRFVLAENGAEMTCVNSAKKALQELEVNEFDLLISDLGMPEMDGYDLIREVRQSNKDYQKNLPAIALTGYVSADDRERVLLAGFQIHLPKPIDIEYLSAIAQQLTQKAEK